MTKGDLEKLKATYRQLTREAHNAKEKYKEAMVKGSFTQLYLAAILLQESVWEGGREWVEEGFA